MRRQIYTRIFVHVLDAVEQGHSKIMIRTVTVETVVTVEKIVTVETVEAAVTVETIVTV